LGTPAVEAACALIASLRCLNDDELFKHMARRRFFVPQVRRGVAELTGDDAEHLMRVLRAQVGELYEISDNENLYLARIAIARKSVVSFEVVEELAAPLQVGKLTLLAALFKFDRFEWMVEKATELGVDEIAPCEAVRTERGLMQAAVKRRVRWERIALEASQQARRVRLPVVGAAARLPEALELAADVKLFLDEDGSASPILRVLSGPAEGAPQVALLSGPEGGWTQAERASATEKGWRPCSLGGTILRAETAAIAGLSVVRAWIDALGEARIFP
jgi:16S rRNA (uracil1498-N3)-methyltransferase